MFNLFKNNDKEQPTDVKALRDNILRFVKDQLQKMEGEGGRIKGLQLFISCPAEDKHLFETALYTDEPANFKNEVQRIADDYALQLPQAWVMEVEFVNEPPVEAIKSQKAPVALFIRTKEQFIQKASTAYIRILGGKAEQDEYEIRSTDSKTNIGREKQVQVNEGYFRKNRIAFPGDAAEENKFISRQHAHIEWNNDIGAFMLYADEGGVPPGNKIKIRQADDDNLIKLSSTEIGHQLKEGDQVILGEGAVIEFSYQPTIK